jgi:hypothetical protein
MSPHSCGRCSGVKSRSEYWKDLFKHFNSARMPWARRRPQSGVFSPDRGWTTMIWLWPRTWVGRNRNSLQFRLEGFKLFQSRSLLRTPVRRLATSAVLPLGGVSANPPRLVQLGAKFFLRDESVQLRRRGGYAGTRSFAFPGCGNKKSSGKSTCHRTLNSMEKNDAT